MRCRLCYIEVTHGGGHVSQGPASPPCLPCLPSDHVCDVFTGVGLAGGADAVLAVPEHVAREVVRAAASKRGRAVRGQGSTVT